MSEQSYRLSVLDSTFLRIETSDTPMHVGMLMEFTIPESAGPRFVADVVAELREQRSLRPRSTRCSWVVRFRGLFLRRARSRRSTWSTTSGIRHCQPQGANVRWVS